MLARTRGVLQNKSKIERQLRARRKSEMLSLRAESEFKARLHDELKHIEVILEDDDVEAVEINVPDKYLSQFSTAIYSDDLASYDVSQSQREANKFLIKRKYIAL